MDVRYYSIFDKKASLYSACFAAANDAVAVRMLSVEVNSEQPNNMMALYPEDYTLFFMFSFNAETGQVTQNDVLSLANGQQLLKN